MISLLFFFVVRVLHLMSAMYIGSYLLFCFVFNIHNTHLQEDELFKQLVGFSGVIMIFSGILLALRYKVSHNEETLFIEKVPYARTTGLPALLPDQVHVVASYHSFL